VWIWTDFLSKQVGHPASRRAAGSTKGQEGGQKQQPARCRTRLKISSQSLPWQGSCCTVAQVRMHELWRYIIHTCICMYIYIYVYAHICALLYIYIYPCIYVCVCVCMYIYIYMCMYTYIYVHVYMYIYMYIYESICNFAESMHAFTGAVVHHACAGVYVRQML